MGFDRRKMTSGPGFLVYAPVQIRSLSRREQLSTANPWLEDIFASAQTPINILIVADGFITFPESEFGLSELITKCLMPSEMIWEKLTIITAHRSKNATADIPGFRFDKLPDPPYNHDLSFYDQIWLFGSETEKDKDGNPNPFTVSDSELKPLSRFMNEGGGVFATGDHDDLGAALCGNVPRVRNMRKWVTADHPPSRDGRDRLDTLREGIEQGFLSNDQSDSIPQEIRPIFKTNGARNGSYPHYLLRKDDGFAIGVLPDHMHEGECIIPHDLRKKIRLEDGTQFEEFPAARGCCERLSPEVIAISTSVGGFVDQLDPAEPVSPRCFNILTAYDGHRASRAASVFNRDRVGRVVVDASFHHFVDINLKGTASGSKAKFGFYDVFNNPTPDYVTIKQYFRNIKLWLCAPEKRTAYYLNMLLATRYLSPLAEEIRPVPDPTMEEIIFAGNATYRALSEIFSPTEAVQCAIHAAGAVSDELRAVLVALYEPWETQTRPPEAALLFNLNLVPKLVLGGAMLGVAAGLPQSPSRVSEVLEADEARYEQLRGFISTGLTHVALSLTQLVPASRNLLGLFVERLDALI